MSVQDSYIGKLDDQFSLDDVGSTLLEDLAKGLYQPDEVLREYIQNGVDAHRMWKNITGTEPEGAVQIEVIGDKITILDYGIGMDESEMRKVKAIAVSKKRDSDVSLTGHKGVGIWAGLSYFESLTIYSTKQGSEFLYKLTIRFKKIVDAINENTNIGDALNPNYDLEFYKEDSQKHYTTIVLQSPTRSREFFTDVNRIKEAITRICPCRVDPTFVFYNKLTDWYAQQGFELYSIKIDGEEVFKSFPSNINTFKTDTITIYDKPVATCWYAFNSKDSGKLTYKDGQLVGFRAVQSGFTIGTQNIYSSEIIPGYDPLKMVASALNWFVGEVHITLKDLRPNLRRNEFEESELTRLFIQRIREWYKKIESQARVVSAESSLKKKYADYEETITSINSSEKYSQDNLASLVDIKKELESQETSVEKNKRKQDVGFNIKALRSLSSKRKRLILDIDLLIVKINAILNEGNNYEEKQDKEDSSRDLEDGEKIPSSESNEEGSYKRLNSKDLNLNNNFVSNPEHLVNDSDVNDLNIGGNCISLDIVLGFLDEVLNEELVENIQIKTRITEKFKKRIIEVMMSV